MIRGSIELVASDIIQGWIYTEDGKVRNAVVLAFQGDVCVGAGKVDSFRPDLADAGMGDGYLGFGFPISVAPSAVGEVFVKLEGSDAILIQKESLVTTGTKPKAGLGRGDVRRHLAALKWALKHGRIAQADFDFIRILWSFGVYERGLVHHTKGEEGVVTDKAPTVASQLLESYLGMEAEIGTERVSDAPTFAAVLAAIAAEPDAAPVVGLSARGRAVLRVVEGSHVDDAASDGRAAPFMDYPLSSENLVMLNARAKAELLISEGAAVEVIWAKPSLS